MKQSLLINLELITFPHRCFKVDVNFDNAEADSFTLGRATYVKQEDGTFSSGKDKVYRMNVNYT